MPHQQRGQTELPSEIWGLCQAFLRGLNALLGEKLYAVYLYGAVAFPDGGSTGDVDFHVILGDGLDDQEKAGLRALHQTLARGHPPLGDVLDGYYVLLEDARRSAPPRHQWLEGVVDASWALHRAHILAGRCIVLHGPDPATIYQAPAWSELVEALQGELDYVKSHLLDYPAYCVLNLCRLMISYETRDVVRSKRAAAKWAREAHPTWQGLIEAAERTYDHTATEEDAALLRSEVERFFQFAVGYIQPWAGRDRP